MTWLQMTCPQICAKLMFFCKSSVNIFFPSWNQPFFFFFLFSFLSLKISHFNTPKQDYWLANARQDQASFIFLVEGATIDTQNLKLKVNHSLDQFSPLNMFMLQLKFEPNSNFYEKDFFGRFFVFDFCWITISTVLFCFLGILINKLD